MTKILIIRFSSIGDIVLTTPVIRCLKQQLPKSEIHYFTKQEFAPLLQNNPYVSKVFTIKRDTGKILRQLKKEKYDFIVDLHHNLRTARVKMTLLRPSSSLNKHNLEKWLYVKLKINKLPSHHIVDRYMETVKCLGVINDSEGLDFFVPVADKIDRSVLPDVFSKGHIGFVIGAKHATKQLPLEKIVSICKKLNRPVILLGGKEDSARAEKVMMQVGGNVFNACGKFNINQSASLIQLADKIISHDTGLMHIAAALKKPIVSVWGNTVPEFGMYPYLSGTGSEGKGTIVEVKNLSCRPCSKLGYSKCPQGHFKCMNEIDEEIIVKFCNAP